MLYPGLYVVCNMITNHGVLMKLAGHYHIRSMDDKWRSVLVWTRYLQDPQKLEFASHAAVPLSALLNAARDVGLIP